MSFTVSEIRQNLFSVFESLLARRNEFLKNPSSDFTRKKKISFAQTMLFPMIAGADNVATELLDICCIIKIPKVADKNGESCISILEKIA